MIYLLYPLLLCTLPLSSLYAQNIGEIKPKDYTDGLAIISVITILGILCLNILVHNIHSSELIFCTSFFFIIYANYVFIYFFSEYKRTLMKYKLGFTFFYLLLTAAAGICIYLFSKHFSLNLISKILFYACAFINICVLSDIFQKLDKIKNNNKNENIVCKRENTDDLPDIYHIIPDAHAGFNRDEFYDEFFKNELEKRGFSICKNPQSSYNTTTYSIPSTLQMDYIHNFVEETQYGFSNAETLSFYANNRLCNILKENGYTLYFSVDPRYEHMITPYIDKEFRKRTQNKNFLITFLIFSSIIAIFTRKIFYTDSKRHFSDILDTYKQFCKANISSPKFAFMHVLAPHTPYLFDENGNKNNPKDYENYQKCYLPYLKYVDKKILDIIDTIQNNAKRKQIIIIHSDHNIRDTKENQFDILLTTKFPEEENQNIIPDNCVLANLYRIILNKYLNTNFEMLDEQFFENNFKDSHLKRVK